MPVRIGNKIHSTFQADRSGESNLWITGCGRLKAGEWIEDAPTCAQCLKAEAKLVDPEKIEVPKLKFGKPETVDQMKAAMTLRKQALKAGARMDWNRQSLESKLRDIQTRIKQGTLSNRCACGKYPWEHGNEKCGPLNPYRRARLRKLFLKLPARSLAGSNELVRKAIG